MDLSFSKVSDIYVAEFVASNDFNLHIEGIDVRDLSVYQRTSATGEYVSVKSAVLNPPHSRVFDYDFSALVYPKFIKVSCATEPAFAEVVSDGEITELKFQSKEVEVTENGIVEVTPDIGFTALNDVQVKVNVPTGGGGAGSSMRYFRVNNTNSEMFSIAMITFATYASFESFSHNGSETPGGVYPTFGQYAAVNTPDAPYDFYDYVKHVKGVCYDRNFHMKVEGALYTPEQLMQYMLGMSAEEFFSAAELAEITEEEFYTL